MELFFRKYFWTFTIVILVFVGLLLGSAAANFVASRLSDYPPEPVTIKKQSDGTRDNTDNLQRGLLINSRNLFDSAARQAAAEAAAGGMGPNGLGASFDGIPGEGGTLDVDDSDLAGMNIVTSSIPVTLRITMVSEDPEWSIAVLANAKDTYVVRKGSMVEGQAEVYAIGREKIYIKNNGRLEVIAFEGVAGPPQAGAAPSTPAGEDPAVRSKPVTSSQAQALSGNDAIAAGVKQVSENDFQIDRSMLDEQLKDLNRLGSQARIVPNYKDGKASGYKLVGVRPGSIFSHIGIRSGDVIQGINGEAIDSPNKALELYQRLQNSSNITIDLERRGQRQSLNYSIR